MSQEAVLRAMGRNYKEDNLWGKLDAEAVLKGADKIATLRAQLAEAQKLRDVVWIVSNKTTSLVFATKEDAELSQCGGASTYIAPFAVPVLRAAAIAKEQSNGGSIQA